MNDLYYSSEAIDKLNAMYNLIIGQRSNGKTYDICKKIVDAYIDRSLPSALIRRQKEEIVGMAIESLFDPHADYINQKTGGKFNGVCYYRRAFYMCRWVKKSTGETERAARDKKAFCKCYAVSTADTTKGADPGQLAYILFDEFITRRYYLTNEFVHFQNLLSTLIRDRPGIKIYMLANTVNKFCPYFAEMGIADVQDMKPGTINMYQDENGERPSIAVEYCAESCNTKKVSQYFNFDNPQLKMIAHGAWEIASYRHAPDDLDDNEIVLSFFILFAGKTVQGDIYSYKGYPLIFFHIKTTPLKNYDNDIVYIPETEDGNPLHNISLGGGQTRAHRLIEHLIKSNKTFFQDNNIGELVNNWLKSALAPKILKS